MIGWILIRLHKYVINNALNELNNNIAIWMTVARFFRRHRHRRCRVDADTLWRCGLLLLFSHSIQYSESKY